jgi:hypothetical protein
MRASNWKRIGDPTPECLVGIGVWPSYISEANKPGSNCDLDVESKYKVCDPQSIQHFGPIPRSFTIVYTEGKRHGCRMKITRGFDFGMFGQCGGIYNRKHKRRTWFCLHIETAPRLDSSNIPKGVFTRVRPTALGAKCRRMVSVRLHRKSG